MGRDVPAITVSQHDRRRYREKVRRCLDVFARMLRESRFEQAPQQVGLGDRAQPGGRGWQPVDAQRGGARGDRATRTGRPSSGSSTWRSTSPPRPLTDDALAGLERDLADSLAHADGRARQAGSPAGDDRHPADAAARRTSPRRRMSANPRYRLLNEQIFAARGEDMRISIDGAGAAAHPRRQHHARGRLHQRPAAPAGQPGGVRAATGTPPRPSPASRSRSAANSPYLFGRELWRETRIPLFEQATDTRPEELQAQGVRPRVWFGERWITSVFDLFEENLRYFPALLPLCEDEDPVAELQTRRHPGAGRADACTTAPSTAGTGPCTPSWTASRTCGWRTGCCRPGRRSSTSSPTPRSTTAWSARWPRRERPIWTQMSFAAAAENLHGGARGTGSTPGCTGPAWARCR